MGTAPLTTSSKPRPGFSLRKAGGGLALLLVLGAIPAMWWGTRYAVYGKLATHLKEERAAAQREGVPLTPTELRASLPKVAAADNAATLYRSLLSESGGSPVVDSGPIEKWLAQRTKRRPDGTPPLPTPVTQEVRASFATLAPRLAIAEKASRLSHCDWDRHWEDGARITFPEMSLGRSLARQFSARALMRAEDGDLNGAFADIETTARISKHMGSDPTLIALLVQTACEAIADRTFTQVALTQPDDPRTLTLARSAEATFRPLDPNDFLRALDGEGVMYRTSVDEYRHDPAAFVRAFSPPSEDGKPSTQSLPSGPPQMLANAWEASGIAHMRNLRTAIKQAPGDDPMAQYNAAAKISTQMETHSKRPGNELLDMVFPIYGQATKRLVDDAARDRLRKTLIALIAARQASGTQTWPASLPVSPSSAPHERTDPFTGKPFHYTTTDSGHAFLLYSVGDNLRDDGGNTGRAVGSHADDISIRFP